MHDIRLETTPASLNSCDGPAADDALTRKVVVVIPAYKPGQELVAVVRGLSEASVAGIVVVDDGSDEIYRQTFDSLQQYAVSLVRHLVNLGKGAALKTGLNHAAVKWPQATTFVTADADGQHLVEDILAVGRSAAADPKRLVMGCRKLDDDNIPLRSKFGNIVTAAVFRLLMGVHLSDTQTGLRGIPRRLLPALLKLKSSGYEFELDMLLVNKYRGAEIREIPIQTIYLESNRSSHFNPILDSAKIYFTLLRFTFTSIMTAILDYTVFILALFAIGLSVGGAQVLARVIALFFNYAVVRKVVFYSDQKHTTVFPRYVMLVILSGFLSFGMITLLSNRLGIDVALAKLISESLVFIANFAIQRGFIFKSQRLR